MYQNKRKHLHQSPFARKIKKTTRKVEEGQVGSRERHQGYMTFVTFENEFNRWGTFLRFAKRNQEDIHVTKVERYLSTALPKTCEYPPGGYSHDKGMVWFLHSPTSLSPDPIDTLQSLVCLPSDPGAYGS